MQRKSHDIIGKKNLDPIELLSDTSRDSRTPVPIVPCTGKECDASGNIGDMSTVPADSSAAVAAQQESASASKGSIS